MGENYEVILYTERSSLTSKLTEKYQNITLKRPRNILDDFILIKYNLINWLENLNINNRVKYFIKFLIRVIFFPFQYLEKKYGFVTAWERNLNAYIQKHEDMQSFHTLITVGAPFVNIKCAYNIKKTNSDLKFIMIQFDLYTDNPVFLLEDKIKDKRNLRLQEEKRWYDVADSILVTNEMKDTIMNSELSHWSRKVHTINMPNLSNLDKYNPKYIFKNKSDINIVYSGMFYKDIRNPSFSLEMFKMLITKDPGIKVHILGRGCEEIVSDFQKQMGDNLIVYGHKEKDYVVNAIYSADFLLNISNRTLSQAPSKILEYIGSCKPIINVFTLPNDICKEYLKKYPFAISIEEDFTQLDQLVNKVYDFINDNKGRKYSFNEIALKYKEFLPETFISTLISLVESK